MDKDPLHFKLSGFEVGVSNGRCIYMISYYLIFLNDMSILTSYTTLDTSILNHVHKIDTTHFV
jgi:hypothetical protein